MGSSSCGAWPVWCPGFSSPFFVLFLQRPEGAWASPAIDVFGTNFAESTFSMIIPLVTFVGFVLAESGAPNRLMQLCRAWLGWLPLSRF